VRVVRPVLLERLGDAPGEAAGERDEPIRVPLEQLEVDPRLVVVALEIAGRGELDQVRVAGVVLGQQRQVRVALLLGLAVVGDVDLAADQRLDALLRRLPVELDCAGKRAVVGEADRGHLELGGPSRERRDAAGPVEDRVLAMDVEVDEGRLRHGRSTIAPGQDRTRAPKPARSARKSTARICREKLRLEQARREVPAGPRP
jgi:hypothetical protein